MLNKAILAASTLAVATAMVGFVAPAQACACDDAEIRVRVSDPTPASGQQFRARGLLIMGGLPAPDHTVKVQARRGGQWVPLRGARVETNDEGRYRVRLVLSQRGARVLRVAGVGEGGEPTQRRRFRVTVH